MALPQCAFVIFGATGDLTKRKLIPALYALHNKNELNAKFTIIAVGRQEHTDESIRTELKSFIKDAKRWNEFSKRISYYKLDFADDAAYKGLAQKLKSERLKVFYLATPPSAFSVIIDRLSKHGIAHKDAGSATERVVFEKPFGSDMKTAHDLNKQITKLFNEQQIYRIDHYLGKEVVQNILLLRFTNPIFENLWDSKHIDNVQIISTEAEGVLERGGYYDSAGALRDMVQNHLLQILALTAMESPASLHADDIRDEKVKVLKSIRLDPPKELAKSLILGQYTAGTAMGKTVPDYRSEKDVKKNSGTETFVAVKFAVHNKRWNGVPFYLRTGKALMHKYAEVVVTFKQAPCVLFCGVDGKLAENKLVLRIQPDEGVKLQFNLKAPGSDISAMPYSMDFSHEAEFGVNTPEAYERLLSDVMRGDQTLFTRWDEVENAWRIVDHLRSCKCTLQKYKAGSHGPQAALDLLKRDGRDWSGNKAIRK